MTQLETSPLMVYVPVEQAAETVSPEECIHAIESGNIQLLQELLNTNSSIDVNRKIGKTTMLCKAAELGCVCMCELLLQWENTDINKTNANRESPVLLAVQNSHITTLGFLLRHGADPDKPSANPSTGYGLTPIHEATFNNSVEMVNLLISYGCDVNNQQRKGYTPLFLAARNNFVHVAKVLLAAGADVDLTNAFGLTPIYEATLHCHVEVMEVLIDAGCNVNISDVYNMSPLHVAAHFASANIHVPQLLLSVGADVSQKAWRKTGRSYPADLAGLKDNHKALHLFLENAAVRGLQCHQKDMLHRLLKQGHMKSAELLVQAHSKHYGTMLPDAYRRVGISLSKTMVWMLLASGVYKQEKLTLEPQHSICTYSKREGILRINHFPCPLSLKNLARIAIREIFGYRCLAHIPLLPLPFLLKDFLLLKDIV